MGKISKLFSVACVFLAGLGAVNTASAALYNQPLPSNAYIIHGGLKWAWVSPFSATGSISPGTSVDLSYQGKFGWRAPTAAELLHAPTAHNFLFAGGNVPNGGVDPVSGSYFGNGNLQPTPVGAGACAAAYFGTYNKGCFWSWGMGSGTADARPWWGMAGSSNDSEVLVVSPVPVPASLPLLIGALGAISLRARRSGRKTVVA